MRKILLLLVLVIGLQTANAQYVSIPDSNFRMALKAKFPACFDSNDRMDTTCSGILNAVSLNVNNKSVSSIQGIQYFKKLFVLNCDSNNITTIPHINDTLYGLFCSHNRITSISTLPRNLKDLDCSYNQLTALPAIDKVSNSLDCSNNPSLSCLPTLFPSVFQGIKIRNTAITCFPNAFGGDADTTLPFCNSPCAFIEINTVTIPDSNFRLALKLKFPTCFNIYDRMDTTCADIINEDTLVVSGKNISSLEGVQYFKKLRRLDCKNNNLTTMPVLSDSLSYLECDNNKLVNLPQFSNQLNVLTCINNLLTYLPVFKPKSSFYQLSCDRNRLITLPVLPFSSMFYLSCSDNQLTSLPSLPNFLYALSCTNNLLSCLPLLPSGLNGLNIKNNNITCLPNATTARVDTILPICTNLNSICEVNPFVQGKIYNDLNNNGVFNNGEELLAEQIVKVSPNNWLGASDVNGTYLVKLDTAINNTWSAINNFRYATITPTSYSLANIHNLGLQSGSYDFGIHFIPNVKDLETTLGSSPARPGFTTNVTVRAINVGTVNQSSITIKLKKPTDFSVLSTSISPTSTINDTLIWNNISINYLAHQSINVQLQVPINAVLGDSALYEAWSNGTQGDTTPLDNYTKWTEVIRGSFDPNDKLVNKET
ncbi:MAG TPA: hypothetical protein PLU17_14135, partial [Chitinophagaceae bacterium]|nr:hypothetical protein [Chitinophagaceae bacterium]